MKLNGSQIVLEVLKEQGVDTIFGYPGGTILNIFDELYKYGDTFKHVFCMKFFKTVTMILQKNALNTCLYLPTLLLL